MVKTSLTGKISFPTKIRIFLARLGMISVDQIILSASILEDKDRAELFAYLARKGPNLLKDAVSRMNERDVVKALSFMNANQILSVIEALPSSSRSTILMALQQREDDDQKIVAVFSNMKAEEVNTSTSDWNLQSRLKLLNSLMRGGNFNQVANLLKGLDIKQKQNFLFSKISQSATTGIVGQEYVKIAKVISFLEDQEILQLFNVVSAGDVAQVVIRLGDRKLPILTALKSMMEINFIIENIVGLKDGNKEAAFILSQWETRGEDIKKIIKSFRNIKNAVSIVNLWSLEKRKKLIYDLSLEACPLAAAIFNECNAEEQKAIFKDLDLSRQISIVSYLDHPTLQSELKKIIFPDQQDFLNASKLAKWDEISPEGIHQIIKYFAPNQIFEILSFLELKNQTEVLKLLPDISIIELLKQHPPNVQAQIYLYLGTEKQRELAELFSVDHLQELINHIKTDAFQNINLSEILPNLSKRKQAAFLSFMNFDQLAQNFKDKSLHDINDILLQMSPERRIEVISNLDARSPKWRDGIWPL